MHTIFDVLSHGRTIVLAHPGSQCVVTWNHSCTLQIWQLRDRGYWHEVDIRTLSEAPASFDDAMGCASDWLDE